MSQNEYRMKIVFDDSQIKDMEKRFMNMFGMKGAGAFKSSSGSESSNPIKNLMKLGGIAAGIGLLVTSVKKILDLTIDASPMLKGMLQLFNNSIMFILRPIGDFIGYMLKPIMVYFLRYVAIPFYKNFDPWMRKYGTKIGDALTGVLAFFATGKAPTNNPTATAILSLNTATASSMVADWLTAALGQYFDPKNPNYIFKGIDFSGISSAWGKITSAFGVMGSTTKIVSDAWASFMGWIGSLNVGLKPLLTAWDKLYSFFSNSIGGAMKVLLTSWDKFYAWFSTIGSVITQVFVKGWDALTGFWQMIIDFLKDPWGTLTKAANPQKPIQPHQVVGSNQLQIGAPQITINIDKALGDASKWASDLEQTILSTLQKWYNRGANP